MWRPYLSPDNTAAAESHHKKMCAFPCPPLIPPSTTTWRPRCATAWCISNSLLA